MSRVGSSGRGQPHAGGNGELCTSHSCAQMPMGHEEGGSHHTSDIHHLGAAPRAPQGHASSSKPVFIQGVFAMQIPLACS